MSSHWQYLNNATDGSKVPASPTKDNSRERQSLVDDQCQQSPHTIPTTSTLGAPLLPGERAPSRSFSSPNFVSPLNPRTPASPFSSYHNSLSGRPRLQSCGSTTVIRSAPGDSQALEGSVPPFSSLGSRERESVVLYRLNAEDDEGMLQPPKLAYNRESAAFSSGDSILSLSSDSKYPTGVTYGGSRRLVPYSYDPATNDREPLNEGDLLHPSDSKGKPSLTFAWRGFLNVGVLLMLISGLLCLFLFYPVLTSLRNTARNLAIDSKIRVNVMGRAPAM